MISRSILVFVLSWLNLSTAKAELISSSFFSPALGVEKKITLYLPRNYEYANHNWPVIYLLHGWGADQNSWSGPELDIATTANQLDLQAIIVMPDGDRSLYVDEVNSDKAQPCGEKELAAEDCVKFRRYHRYFIDDVMGFIKKHYRINSSRKAQALMGESAGGGSAMRLLLQHPDLFSVVVSHSGTLSILSKPGDKPGTVLLRTSDEELNSAHPAMQQIFGKKITNWQVNEPANLIASVKNYSLSIYFDCGKQDEYGFADLSRYFSQQLSAQGINHHFELVDGDHDESLWHQRSVIGLQFIMTHFKNGALYSEEMAKDNHESH